MSKLTELRSRLRRCERLLRAAHGGLCDTFSAMDPNEKRHPIVRGHIRIADQIEKYFTEEELKSALNNAPPAPAPKAQVRP